MSVELLASHVSIDVRDSEFRRSMRDTSRQIAYTERQFQRMGRTGDRAFRDMDAAAKRFNRTLRTVRTYSMGAATAFALGLAYTARTTSKAQETLNRFRQTFREFADDANHFARTFGESVGRSQITLQSSLASFQAFFKGLEFGNEQATQMSKLMTQLVTDFGSFQDMADEEALRRFISALAGSSEVLDRYGINTKEARLNQWFLEQGMDRTTRSATEQEKTIARLDIIMQTMTRQGAVGDAARTQDFFANRVRRLRSEFEQLVITVGQDVVPIVESIVKQIQALVDTLGQSGSNLGSFLYQGFLTTASPQISSRIGGALGTFGASRMRGRSGGLVGAGGGLGGALLGSMQTQALSANTAALGVNTVAINALNSTFLTAMRASMGGMVASGRTRIGGRRAGLLTGPAAAIAAGGAIGGGGARGAIRRDGGFQFGTKSMFAGLAAVTFAVNEMAAVASDMVLTGKTAQEALDGRIAFWHNFASIMQTVGSNMLESGNLLLEGAGAVVTALGGIGQFITGGANLSGQSRKAFREVAKAEETIQTLRNRDIPGLPQVPGVRQPTLQERKEAILRQRVQNDPRMTRFNQEREALQNALGAMQDFFVQAARSDSTEAMRSIISRRGNAEDRRRLAEMEERYARSYGQIDIGAETRELLNEIIRREIDARYDVINKTKEQQAALERNIRAENDAAAAMQAEINARQEFVSRRLKQLGFDDQQDVTEAINGLKSLSPVLQKLNELQRLEAASAAMTAPGFTQGLNPSQQAFYRQRRQEQQKALGASFRELQVADLAQSSNPMLAAQARLMQFMKSGRREELSGLYGENRGLSMYQAEYSELARELARSLADTPVIQQASMTGASEMWAQIQQSVLDQSLEQQAMQQRDRQIIILEKQVESLDQLNETMQQKTFGGTAQ